MSMLAEPRRKQKWTLNPRGKQWSDDSNKFGQKMLEKMGWSNGKGLGAKEQGMTEHVRVSIKNDTSGIGFKADGLNEAWTEHQDSFNDFLQELQKSQNSDIVPEVEVKNESLSGKSLELKSKQSRARVHYHKFTRGKDVNKYSSKDLANIFGQKDLGVSNVKKKQCEDIENSDEIGKEDNRGGVITIHGGNMAEYFLKKGQNFSKSSPHKNSAPLADSESENEHVGFGYASTKGTETISNYAFENPCMNLNSPKSNVDLNSSRKVPKKRKSDISDMNESELINQSKKLKEDAVTKAESKNGFVNAALNLESQFNETCNGKEFEVSRAQFGLANTALDLSDEIDDKKRVTFNDHIEYSSDPIKKKKGKARLDKFEVESKKHKRKRKREESNSSSVPSGFVNEALEFEEISEEINDNEVNERKSKKTKKRKESRRSNLETIVETPEEDKETYENKTDINIMKDEGSIDECIVLEEIHSPEKMKKKKKKRKEKIEEESVIESRSGRLETITEEIVEEIQIDCSDDNEIELDKIGDQLKSSREGKKKKKKKSKNNNTAEEEQENTVIGAELRHEETDVRNKGLMQESGSTISKVRKERTRKNKSHNHTSNENVETSIEKEKEDVDKENADYQQESVATKVKKPKKSKKHRELSEQSTFHNDDTVHSMESGKNEVENINSTHTPMKKTENNETFHVIRSPWNEKARMSKRLLKSLFHRNSVSNFPGSNIHEIKGYGADIE